jgi:ketosteroid isomerase-like protein
MDKGSAPTLSRAATAAAFQQHLVAKGDYSGAWDRLADLFADDATYSDVFYGHMRGKEAIRDFLRRSMKGIEDWSFPVQWTEIGEGRVVVHWMNRLPKRRRDGSPYEFPGISVITYDAAGRIASQMDLYDGLSALRIIAEARAGALGGGLRRVLGVAGPAARELFRKVIPSS